MEYFYHFFHITILITYFFTLYKLKLKFISFTSVAILTAWVFAIIPGFYVADGSIVKRHFVHVYNGFSLDVIILYLFTIITIPLFTLLGRITAKSTYINISLTKSKKPIYIAWGLILGFLISYFLWVPEIPLLKIGIFEKMDVLKSRVNLTHMLFKSKDAPSIFFYRKSMLWINLTFLSLLTIWGLTKNIKRKFHLALTLGALLIFTHIYTTEKIPLLFLIGAIAMFILLNYSINIKKVILPFVVCCTVIFIYMYSSFMNISVIETPASIIKRISKQTSGTYYVVNKYNHSPPTFFKYIKMNYLNEKVKSPNEESYKKMYLKHYEQKHIVGSSSVLSLARFYPGLKWFSLYIFCSFLFAYGFIDQTFLNAISLSIRNKIDFYALTAFYSTVTLYSWSVFTTDIFKVFSIPSFFIRPYYPVVIFFLLLFRFKKISFTNEPHQS